MTEQLRLDLCRRPQDRPPAKTPSAFRHLGPGQVDEGDGCDCCAQRLLCSKCGKRYLARVYAYYYRCDTRDADGYCVARDNDYNDLLGPCCLPNEPERFDELMGNDYPALVLKQGEVVRKGEYVVGPHGVLLGRIWTPESGEWPTGESEWRRPQRLAEEERERRRGKRKEVKEVDDQGRGDEDDAQRQDGERGELDAGTDRENLDLRRGYAE